MKKGAILLIFILVLLQLVNAQEINILGNKYSLLLVVPVAFMALIILFFIGTIIKDAIGNISLPKLRLKPKHHGVKQVKDEKTIYKEFTSNYATLKNKAHNLTAPEYFDNLIVLIKGYLKFKHGVNQEFIFEDVPNFRKASQDEINLANKIVSLKYSGIELTRDHVREVDELFRRILNPKLPEEKEMHRVSIFSKLRNLFKIKHHARVEHKETPVIKYKEEKIHAVLEKEKKIHHENFVKKFFINLKRKKILDLINYGKGFIVKNPIKAKRYFGIALLKYHKLKVKKDEIISRELESFSRELLKHHPHEKHFFDISKKIIALKHAGKNLTFETLNAIRNIKNLLKHEKRLISVRLREFSKKLELEKKKLEHLNKTKEKQIKKEKLDVEELKEETPEAPQMPKFPEAPKLKIKEIVKGAPTPNYEIIQKRNKILNLLRDAHSTLRENPELAKRYYGQALLKYYELPIKKDDLIYSRIMRFHEEMFKHHREKHSFLFEIGKSLINLKHMGKQLSSKAFKLLDSFNNLIRKEEDLIATKIKRDIREIKQELSNKEKEYSAELKEIYTKREKIEKERRRKELLERERLERLRAEEKKKELIEREHLERERLKQQRKKERLVKEHLEKLKKEEMVEREKLFENLIRKIPEHPKLELPKAPRLFVKDLVKEAPEAINPKVNIKNFPELVKQGEQKAKILPKEMTSKILSNYNRYGIKTVQREKRYKEYNVLRDYIIPDVPKYTKISQRDTSKHVELVRYSPKEVKEKIKDIPEPKIISIKPKSPEVSLPKLKMNDLIKETPKFIKQKLDISSFPEVPGSLKQVKPKIEKLSELPVMQKTAKPKLDIEKFPEPPESLKQQITLLPKFPQAPKLKIKDIIKEAPKVIKPELDIEKLPEVPEALKQIELKRLPYKKLLPESLLKKTLEYYNRYGTKTMPRREGYVEREVVRDYVTPNLPRYTFIKQEKKYIVPDVPISMKISEKEMVTPEVGIFRYKPREVKEIVKEIPEPKKIDVKLEPLNPPLPFKQELEEEEYKKVLSAYKKYGEKLAPKEVEYEEHEHGKEIKYVKSDLPQNTKIIQEKFIMPMPKIEIIDYKPSKRVNDIKREEEELYNKLLKLESF